MGLGIVIGWVAIGFAGLLALATQNLEVFFYGSVAGQAVTAVVMAVESE